MPVKIAGRMSGPALPLSCAIQLQLGSCGDGKYPQGLAAKESEGARGFSARESCQHQGRASQRARTGWAWTKQQSPPDSDPRRGRWDRVCIAGENPRRVPTTGIPLCEHKQDGTRRP